MVNDIDHQLKHWGAWARDNGAWRKLCRSIEHRYSFDLERYRFADDSEKQNRFRYEIKIAEKVEKIIISLPGTEKMILIAAYVYFPHLSDEQVAKKLDIPNRIYTSRLESACRYVRRHYA